MPEAPLVTIVTPSFNQGAFLEQTILSVLNQDYPNIEYIVIDGGSTDESVEIIRRYAGRLAYWESQPDLGQAHAINKGLERAHGDILGWLNSDDLLLPETVSRTIQAFAEHPQVDVVYGRLERIDENGARVPTPVLPKDQVVFSAYLALGECVVNQPGSFWRRRAMEKAGLLDPHLVYALDYEYWIRMVLNGAQFMRLSEVVAQFRLSRASKTVSQAAEMAVEQCEMLEGLLHQPDLPARLGMTPSLVQRQAYKTRAVLSLYAFYGYLKLKRPTEAARWLVRALASDPAVLLQRRWIDLAVTGLARRVNRLGQ